MWISVSNGGPGFQTLTGKRLPIVDSIAACVFRGDSLNDTLSEIMLISSVPLSSELKHTLKEAVFEFAWGHREK